MNALDLSDDLLRRGGELRARSQRIRAAADEKMDKSRRLRAAAAQAREMMMHARGQAHDGLFARRGRLLASLSWVQILGVARGRTPGAFRPRCGSPGRCS